MHPNAGALGASTQLTSLSAVIGQVLLIAQSERVSLRKVMEQVGDASFAPVLLLPAVAVATPLSGVPFFSSLMGIVICLISLQMLLRRRQIWLPDWVLRRRLQGDVVCKAFQAIYPAARWIDARTGKRLHILSHRPFVYIPQLICLLSGAIMPLLEFVPFSSSIMGAGVALLAVGMLARDGLVILLGLLPYGLVGWVIMTATA